MVCEEEYNPHHLRHASLNSLPLGTIGKCCPEGHHTVVENIIDKVDGKIFNFRYNCVIDDNDYDFLADSKIRAANITNFAFTSTPLCETGFVYHTYELSSMDEDEEAFVDVLQDLIVVDKIGKCIQGKTPVRKEKYCLDYQTKGSDIKIIGIVCQANYHNEELKHPEKHSIMATLLGVSCAALLATAASLLSTRVRRGLVTVKKVNTLAGRILLSYVMSYLLGFLTLAVAHKATLTADMVGCQAIAGVIMFFMLAAFHWNTSICLESLLLTLRVSTSEGRRYILHSLWAWGLPGFITALALSLDAYKESLSCNTITLRIGVLRCFISDPRAQILYFYLPMFITLIANLGLLLGARSVRINNLRKLEHGPNRRKKGNVESTELQGRGTGGDAKTEKQAAKPKEPQSSGMRTHQNRNLWLEAVKLVMWSGVTLSIEVVSYIIFRFHGENGVAHESWHEYLWYIPSMVNSLRGLGIFAILVLTEENRKKLARAIGTLSSLAGGVGSSPRQTHSAYSSDDSAVGNSSIGGNGGRRNMSVTTTITQISSIRNKCINNGNDVRSNPCSDTAPHKGLAKSVSQIQRHGSISSESDFDGLDVDSEGNRRRPSLAVVGMTALESVDEEDVYDQQMISKEPINNKNFSDA
ncbi:unnamed protein product [Meganyctiphanes norvegica]|uniref:G-protein coupled receptors family 2 profile 2 domain-containing protein n=1 Tax=Meganyctiphanes norvegica TaxID=48144 RepID=A0AAV2SW30_MEGNR